MFLVYQLVQIDFFVSTNTVFLSSGTIFGIADVLESPSYGVVAMKIKPTGGEMCSTIIKVCCLGFFATISGTEKFFIP